MSDLRVRIGPSVDRAAFDAVFTSISQSAKRAFGKIGDYAEKESARETGATKKSGDTFEKTQKKKYDALVRETQKWQRQDEKAQQASARAQEKAERMKTATAKRETKERAAAEREYYREMERQQRQAVQSQRRMVLDMKRQARDAARPRVGVGLGHGVSVAASGMFGAGMGAMRFGMGIAGDIAHAYGVDTDLGSLMHKNADMDTLATQITNEAHEKGQKFANAEDLKSRAFDVGSKTGTGANQMLEGVQEFVGRTGDLNTASASMENLAKIAKATGTNLKDVFGAAASVSNQLGNVPDKVNKVNEVMRILAGESKLGAVSMRSLAAQAPRIVAQAQLMDGDVGKNMGLLGAVAQEAGLHGGSANAAQSATAVTSLMATFSKGARLDAFDKLKISTSSGGKMRNVEDIIVESLQKTQHGSDAEKTNKAFGKLFADQRARVGVRGFESIFRSTYGSASGTEQERLAEATKAVRAEFDRLQRAAMDQKEVEDSFNRAMKTGQSQAELWNNATQKAAREMQDAFLPAMIQLTPKIVSATHEFTNFVDFLTGKQKTPDSGPLAEDMDAIHKAMANGGKVDQALVTKSIKDAQDLGAQATDKENEARGLKEHAALDRFAGGIKENGVSGILGLINPFANHEEFGKTFQKGSDRATSDQKKAERDAKEAGDQAMRAFKELTSATLKVHIVSSDVTGKEAPGAANPSTDSLSDKPSK